MITNLSNISTAYQLISLHTNGNSCTLPIYTNTIKIYAYPYIIVEGCVCPCRLSDMQTSKNSAPFLESVSSSLYH